MNDETLRERVAGLILAGIILIGTVAAYSVGYTNGHDKGSATEAARWTTAIVKNGAGKWIVENGEPRIEFRVVPFKADGPVVEFRDADGQTIRSEK